MKNLIIVQSYTKLGIHGYPRTRLLAKGLLGVFIEEFNLRVRNSHQVHLFYEYFIDGLSEQEHSKIINSVTESAAGTSNYLVVVTNGSVSHTLRDKKINIINAYDLVHKLLDQIDTDCGDLSTEEEKIKMLAKMFLAAMFSRLEED